MKAAEKLAAAEMTLALSQRVSELAELDREDLWDERVPPQRTPCP